MKAIAAGTTPYTLRKAIASAPAVESSQVGIVSVGYIDVDKWRGSVSQQASQPDVSIVVTTTIGGWDAYGAECHI
jgi:hypothetical protein